MASSCQAALGSQPARHRRVDAAREQQQRRGRSTPTGSPPGAARVAGVDERDVGSRPRRRRCSAGVWTSTGSPGASTMRAPTWRAISGEVGGKRLSARRASTLKVGAPAAALRLGARAGSMAACEIAPSVAADHRRRRQRRPGRTPASSARTSASSAPSRLGRPRRAGGRAAVRRAPGHAGTARRSVVDQRAARRGGGCRPSRKARRSGSRTTLAWAVRPARRLASALDAAQRARDARDRCVRVGR